VVLIDDKQIVLAFLVFLGEHLVEKLFDFVAIFTFVAILLRPGEPSLVLAFLDDPVKVFVAV
jgi:hypothetical protein